MRKLITITAAAVTLLFFPQLTVSAVDLNAPLPVEVIADNGWGEIRKIYELPKSVDKRTIPITDIEQNGVTYTCTDVIYAEIAQADFREHVETFTTEAPTDDEATLAEAMPPEREVVTEDGFEGTLRLLPDTLAVEPTGYNTNVWTQTVTRSYPNQASQDLEHLPKEVTENSRVYALSDVNWHTDNTYNSDDYEIGDRYTALCTYSREVTSVTPKAFTVTATYAGQLEHPRDALIRYTVIFTKVAEPIPYETLVVTVAPEVTLEPAVTASPAEPQPSGGSSGIYAAIGAVGVVAAGAVAALVLMKMGMLSFKRRDSTAVQPPINNASSGSNDTFSGV